MAKPLAVFALTHPWMQKMTLESAPDGFEVLFVDGEDEEQVQDLYPQADFLMANRLTVEHVSLLKRCKLVQLQGVGYDAIDVDALSRAGIPLAATPEGTTVGVSEHTILLILALYKRILQVHESMRQGRFESIDWRSSSHFLYQKTVAIVGLGRIGQRVARLAKAFETTLIYFDVVRPPAAVEEELGITYLAFDELLPVADIISVHTPLTPQTTKLFAAGEFARMKPGAIFVNTSRGGTYDMDALYDSLRAGHLGGAGLDVFNPEPPPPNHPLLQLSNVVCTPHAATGTVEAHRFKAQAQFDNFQRALNGETLHNLIVPAQ